MVCTKSKVVIWKALLTLEFQFSKVHFSVSMELVVFIEDFHADNVRLTETGGGDTLWNSSSRWAQPCQMLSNT